ncbi:MAG: response regulator [Alphaproteobacteria bacterium]|nr:response regulator [Alphaproteobacteria bacterium]
MAKIVCIEDEPEIREDIVEALEIQGHTISEAENGEQGLETILRVRPDLIISDITMPILDGLGLLAKIRSEYPECADMPFVFLSALADRKDLIAGRELGADDYLTKPVDFELMYVVVKAKLRQVQRMQENKDRQLLKMYGALTNMPILEAEPAADALREKRLNIVSIVNDEVDLSEVHKAIQSRGHVLSCMKSGRKFLETVDSLAPDLLLISFSTEDIQAPMMIKMLQAAGPYTFRKILLLPPSVPDFPAVGKLPSFDIHLRAPLDAEEIMAQIESLSRNLRHSDDLLAVS